MHKTQNPIQGNVWSPRGQRDEPDISISIHGLVLGISLQILKPDKL